MKARFSYPLVFLVPWLMLASLAAFTAAVAGAGVTWIFVFGDDPWPDAAEQVIMGSAVVVLVGVFSALTFASHVYGKRREALGGLARAHVIAAVVISLLLPALFILSM